jgi:signal transduction histidine kinase
MDTKIWADIVKEIYSEIELEDCLKVSIEKVTELLGVEMGSLMLLDKESQELSIKVAKGLSEEITKNAKTKIGEGISGWVAENRKPLLIEDIEKDTRFRKRNGKYHNDSLLSVPLLADDQLLGVINVNNKSTKEIFSEEDLNILNKISIYISDAIDNALKYEEAKRLSQLKLDFVSTVSHELRSPLSSVREAMSLILDRVTGEINNEQEKFLTISRNNIDRIIRLIEELLDLSKLEAGRLDMKRRFGDICEVARQAYDTLKINAAKKNIKLKLELASQNIDMWFDSDQIIRVIINLLGNAIKFTQENGMVNIKVEDVGRFVKISVIDNGPGISEDDIGKIFDKFYSVAKAKSSGEKGTGLGLPIAKEIVELHKGRMWVDSQLGHGSRFSFMLPKDIRTI